MTTFREPPPKPFLKWVGGKRQLLPELLEAVESAGDFERYHEPFLGGGALFFALSRTGRLAGRAYLSDVNDNLVSTYTGVRDEIRAVIRTLKEHQKNHCETYFYRVRESTPRTPARRAARLIYLNKTCYNGLYRENSKGKFNAPFGRYVNPRICDEGNLLAVSDALANVRLDARDFSTVPRFARPGDLVYFDPPYHPISRTADFTAYSRDGFGARSQEKLARTFAALAARGVKVILSNSLTDFTTQLYADFYVYEVHANRMVNSKASRRGKVSEALITSFPLTSGRSLFAAPRRLNGTARSKAADGRLQRIMARPWLRHNGYSDVADLIAEVTAEWRSQGKRTRRNWWQILAGDSRGNSRVVAGRRFPVLRAAQIRQGVPVTSNAECRNADEQVPSVRVVPPRQ